MISFLKLAICGLLFACTVTAPVLADEAACGVAPALSSTAEEAESIKGELEGQADFLSEYVGKAELSGQIEAARKKIYQTSDAFFAAQKDAYLAYMFCIIVMKDKTLDTQKKLEALEKFKNAKTGDADASPDKSPYNWRKDAERANYIYSGRAYCDRHNIQTTECINTRVGSFTLPKENTSFEHTLTITSRTISVRTQEFLRGVLHKDIKAEANMEDLNAYTSVYTGDLTTMGTLSIECLAGDCVRWTGWNYVSPKPGVAEKKTYSDEAVISYFWVPLAKNIDHELRLELRRIFARLISEEHTDTGEIACKFLCTLPSCPWMTDDCAKMLYGKASDQAYPE